MKCAQCGAALRSPDEACPSCGASQGAGDERLAAGTKIAGKYEIVDELGAGGMGRVYKAVQAPFGTHVCIKTLHGGAFSDPQFAARFEQEARAMSMLRHPGIVSVFDFGTHIDGTMYLVMELVEGTTLGPISKDKVLSAQRAVHIVNQLLDALSFAHAQGIVHRDLKPSNVMIQQLPGQPDFVKVLDFGSALLTQGNEGERLTRAGMLIGTPAFMPPEYILGRGVDARVDVYQVGILLYGLLVGSLPFRGTPQQVFAQQVSVAPELPSKRNPNADVSIAMERAIMRSLIKDPAHRYASAADFRSALEAALRGVTDETDLSFVDGGGGIGVEIAHDERPVIVLSVRSPTGTLDAEAVGTVARSRGGVMAQPGDTQRILFGLDRDIPEAAADAMKCALDLAGDAVPYRVGIRDAQASCKGRFGHAGFEYELFGDGAGLADALAHHAAPGQAFISGPVARHVPADIRMVPVPPPAASKEPAFALIDPLQAAGLQGKLEFVGRAEQQRTLLEMAVNAKDGRVLVVRAPFGMGKTRLLEELISQAARLGVLWCVVPATASTEVGPAHPVSMLAAIGWSIVSGGASTTERYAVEVMLGRSDRLTDTFAGERRQSRLVSAALEGVSRRVSQGPVVVVLDELELADDLTWSMASRLVDMASELKVSVILGLRPETEIPFRLPDDVSWMELGPLSEKEMLALASSSEAGVDDATARALTLVCRGVPVLLEESLAALQRGLGGEIAHIQGTGVVQGVTRLLRARIDRLEDSAIWFLRVAAVVGPEPRLVEVRALADLGDAESAALSELRQAGLLLRTPAGRLQFVSPLTRPVTLKAMDQELRRALHAKAADALKGRGKQVARVAELGEHLYLSSQWREAFDSLSEAGEVAHRDGAIQQAVRLFKLAIAASSKIGPGHLADGAKVARRLGCLLMDAGRLDEAEQIFEQAFAPARQADAHDLAADLLRLHGRSLMLKGDVEEGRQEIESALLFADKRGFHQVAAEACGDLSEIAERKGAHEEAVTVLRSGLDLIEGREDREASVLRIQLYNRLGRLELVGGKRTSAIALFAQALSIAERVQDRFQAAGLLGNLGGAYAQEGEMERAVHFTERALRESEAIGDQIGIARQSFNLALLRLKTGQRDAARRLLQTGHDASRRAGWREGLAMNTAALAKLGAAR